MKILEGLPAAAGWPGLPRRVCDGCPIEGAGAALQQGSVTVLLPPTPHTNPLCG